MISMKRLLPCVLAASTAILWTAIVALADDKIQSKKPTAAEPAKKLTDADNGKTITVKVGDVVAISLIGNPTTGYSWRTAKLDGKAIEQVGEPKYTTNPHRQGMVGVGGTFLFKFNATKSGKTEVKLEYVRPWERGKKPIKTFTTTVEVEDK
jgi:inhibitor of cysteine peptidase